MTRYLAIVTAVLVSGLLLVACGDDDEDEGAATGVTPTVEATAETEGAPPPVSGETTTTESGLQIIDIEEGSGSEAKAGQVVTVHYTGWLTDGTKFDSSVDRGQPFSFTLGAGQVIAGWDEGVAGMKVDGKRRLIIPSNLAYGPQARPPSIPANADLIFDVELLAIPEP